MLIQGCSTPNSGNSNIPNGSLGPDNGSSKLKVMLIQGCSTPNSGSSNLEQWQLYLRIYPLLQIKLASDKISESGKPRGYAFIEYEHERDMHYCSN
ncbi:RU17-like protein [Mya arenaria]|uniref:RU17-like protein n=1 Tax=Mya arenaria TaxID=6604 RepID=A0ABY7E4V9_MYAAR|nr:RU17-like protein [Mya arenaria]